MPRDAIPCEADSIRNHRRALPHTSLFSPVRAALSNGASSIYGPGPQGLLTIGAPGTAPGMAPELCL